MPVIKRKTEKAITKQVKKLVKKHGPEVALGLATTLVGSVVEAVSGKSKDGSKKKKNASDKKKEKPQKKAKAEDTKTGDTKTGDTKTNATPKKKKKATARETASTAKS